MQRKKQKIIGLTGGIATGKSTIAGMFRELGVKTLDTDKIAHAVLRKPDVRKKVLKKFGVTSRPALAKIVFKNARKRKGLEKILHSLIWKEVKKRIRGLTIVEVPLLFETGWDKRVDATIVVTCSKKTQKKRCPPEFKDRIAAQMPLSEKIKRADFVIDNSESIDKTRKQVQNFNRLLE